MTDLDMNATVEQLVVILGVIAALSLAYAKGVSAPQKEITQAFIDAFKVPSRYRRGLNMLVGVGLGIIVTIVGALWLGTWSIVPVGILAGVLASVEAGKVHDGEAAQEAEAKTKRMATLTQRPGIRQ